MNIPATIAQQKRQLRQQAKSTRSGLDMPTLSQVLRATLLMLPEIQDAQHLLLYYPLPNEPDFLGLIPTLPHATVYLPRITERNTLRFHHYEIGDTLIENDTFHVPEPLNSAPTFNITKSPSDEIICIILPALMADNNGYRLGYGKSFYDRFLSGLTKASTDSRKLYTVIALPQALKEIHLPTEPWDVAAQIVVTEQETIYTQPLDLIHPSR